MIRLALHMGRTPAELGAAMTGPELDELIAFDNLYYLPDAYTVAALVCNSIDRAMTTNPRRVEDILPYFEPERRSVAKELLARFGAMAAAMRAKGFPANGAGDQAGGGERNGDQAGG